MTRNQATRLSADFASLLPNVDGFESRCAVQIGSVNGETAIDQRNESAFQVGVSSTCSALDNSIECSLDSLEDTLVEYGLRDVRDEAFAAFEQVVAQLCAEQGLARRNA